MLDNTIVIITGDHGQEFNESKKNNWGHSSNFSRWQTQIPFILHDPKNKISADYEHVTTHYDVVPTLLKNYLGVQNSIKDYSLGEMLHDDVDRYPFWSGGNDEFKVRTSLIFKDFLLTAEHDLGLYFITDRNLNPLPDKSLAPYRKGFEKAKEQKQRFYKKNNSK